MATNAQALPSEPTDQIADVSFTVKECADGQLAESVADLETRKNKLTAQLAKLNGEILISELPRSKSGQPFSPLRTKRRRISDFTFMGNGRLGLGTPKKVASDRRAVSGLTRLNEEHMPSMIEEVESMEVHSVSTTRGDGS
jgi:hypothetical protein